jgi:hypothetical protein
MLSQNHLTVFPAAAKLQQDLLVAACVYQLEVFDACLRDAATEVQHKRADLRKKAGKEAESLLRTPALSRSCLCYFRFLRHDSPLHST